jgi:hypothetical protein
MQAANCRFSKATVYDGFAQTNAAAHGEHPARYVISFATQAYPSRLAAVIREAGTRDDVARGRLICRGDRREV